ncbi:MAG: MATE family efflux transporter [Oscillospiraceae bacterium]|nr:MATE family efflux transporter [Oscillospiraceae bacterium]
MNERKTIKGDMTVGNPARLILSFSIPLLLGNVLQQMYNMADSIVVGNYVGTTALAAVGTGFPIIYMMVALFMGIGGGATVIISQYYGAGDLKKVSETVDTIYTFGIVGAIPISVIGILLSGPMLRLINTPDDTLPDARLYMTIIFAGTIFALGYNLNSAIMQSLGDSKTPLLLLSITCGLNILLDLLFVIVFQWGVVGVAVATIFSQAVSWGVGILLVNRKYTYIHVNPLKFFFDRELFGKIIRLGLPAGLQQMLFSVGTLALQSLVNGYGSDFMAGFNGANKIDMFAFFPAQSFGMALTTYVGQNIGAGKMHRVKEGLRATMVMSVLCGIGAMALVLGCGTNMMHLFSREAAVVEAGMIYLRPVMYCYLLFAVMNTFLSVLRGAGDMVFPMITSLLSLWLIRLPMAYLLAYFFGKEYIFFSYGGGWVIGMTMAIVYYFGGRWKKKAVVSRRREEDLPVECE